MSRKKPAPEVGPYITLPVADLRILVDLASTSAAPGTDLDIQTVDKWVAKLKPEKK